MTRRGSALFNKVFLELPPLYLSLSHGFFLLLFPPCPVLRCVAKQGGGAATVAFRGQEGNQAGRRRSGKTNFAFFLLLPPFFRVVHLRSVLSLTHTENSRTRQTRFQFRPSSLSPAGLSSSLMIRDRKTASPCTRREGEARYPPLLLQSGNSYGVGLRYTT